MLLISTTDLIILIVSGVIGGALGPILVKKLKKISHSEK